MPGTQPTDCPLCGRHDDDTRRVYVHLMGDHRKSEISRALMEATGSRTELVAVHR